MEMINNVNIRAKIKSARRKHRANLCHFGVGWGFLDLIPEKKK
jgi:hypothetical protein